MKLIEFKFDNYCYPFFLGTDCTNSVIKKIISLDADAYFVVADERVAKLYGEELCSKLSMKVVSHLIRHQEGEKAKTLTTVEMVIEKVLNLGASRRSCILALGGGVTGNLAGLVAALAFRGIRLVHIPTTLIAILDSVLSLKQAVNASCGKNLVGTFYRPEMVLADTAYLHTLSLPHIRSGLCEVIKNALAICPDEIPFLKQILNKENNYNDATYRELIYRSILVKSSVMKHDKYERCSGLVLEYGHTVGHAIEHLANGIISHGEAVGLGMLVAAEISKKTGFLSENDCQIHWELIQQVNSSCKLPYNLDLNDLLSRIFYDNKRGYIPVEDNVVPMVILEKLGKPKWNNEHPLYKVSFSELKEAVLLITTEENYKK